MTISEVSPVATVVLNGAGAGQCAIGPPSGTKWALRLATVAVSTAVRQPQAKLYRGSASGPLELVDATNLGAGASSSKVGGALYYPGQRLWAVWSGGDAGATATLQAYGTQAGRADPLPQALGGEGFDTQLTTLVIPTGATTGARIVIDGTTGEIDIYNAAGALTASISSSTDITVFGANGSQLALTTAGAIPEIAMRPQNNGTHTYAPAGITVDEQVDTSPFLSLTGPAEDGGRAAAITVQGQGPTSPATIFLSAPGVGGLVEVTDGELRADVALTVAGNQVLPSNTAVINTAGAGQDFTVAARTPITGVSGSFTKLAAATQVLVEMSGGGFSSVGTGYGITYGITVQGVGDLLLGGFNWNQLNVHAAFCAAAIFAAFPAGTYTINGWISGVAGNTTRTDAGDTWSITLTEIV